MITEPTADPADHLDPTAVPTHVAPPYGIAPLALDASLPSHRRRSVRRRLVDAAVVSSALATIPITAVWRADEGAPTPTLAEAVSELDAADDATGVRATARVLRAAGSTDATPAAGLPVAVPARAGVSVAAAPLPAEDPVAPPTDPSAAARPAPSSPLTAAAAAATADEPTPVARAAGVELVTPSTETVLVGFHEAAGSGTEPMESLAPLAVDLNAKETPVATDASPDQVAPVMELPTRERAAAAASAVDVAVPAWEDILAPVSGEVVAAEAYTLYGQYADNIVEIEPDGHPGVRVKMVHIGEVQVRPGDRVVAGETVVAGTAKLFPFSSQIDRFSEEVSGRAHPHVHIEVRRTG